MKTGFGAVLAMAAAAGLAGCSRQAPPGDTEHPLVPQTFTFTATNETVAVTNIPRAGTSESVTADFNLDGLCDLAVIESPKEESPRVTIYIRQPILPQAALSQLATFYRGGEIRLESGASIIGLMTRGGERYSDLIILVRHAKQPNEMIHFANDGVRFTRRSAPPSSMTPAPAAPAKGRGR